MRKKVYCLIFSFAALVGFTAQSRAQSLSTWTSTTSYPTSISEQSCVVNSGYVYCVGGNNSNGAGFSFTNAVFYAPLSSSGAGPWTATTFYPVPVAEQSCVVNSGYVYCVGGYQTDAVYYAPLSSSGVGSWTTTTSYPISVSLQSCVVNSGYVYCVGGDNGGSPTNAVYYAPLSSSGVGSWTATTSYPISVYIQSCAANSGYVYCVGGYSGGNAVYYAPLSSSGVGSWTATTSYPASISSQSCVVNSGYVYCVGGYSGSSATNAVYYAPLSSGGVGPWIVTTAYPINIGDQSCAVNSGYVYCVGGYQTNAVYYAGIQPNLNLSATALGVSSITWAWNAVSGATSYDFYPSTGGPPINLSGTTFTQTNLSTNTSYGAQVAVLYSGGASAPSAIVSIYTLAAPPASAASTFTAVDFSSMTVAWLPNGNPINVTTYTVILTTSSFYPNADSGNISLSTMPAGNFPEAILSGLISNAAYFLFVNAVNGNGVPTAHVGLSSAATLTAEPGFVSPIFSSVNLSSVAIHWSSGGNSLGTSYIAQISTDGFSTILDSSSTQNLSALFGVGGIGAALSANTMYYFQVQAVGVDNSSPFLNLGSTSTLAESPATAVPTFDSINIDSATVSWSANGNPLDVTAYDVVLSSSSNYPNIDSGNSILLSTAPIGSIPTSTLGGLNPNTTYFLFVSALNSNGVETNFVNLGSTSTLAAFPLALAPTNISSASVTANWGAGGNSLTTLYVAQVSTNGFTTLNASSSTLSDAALFAGLVPATLYNFRVEAIGNNGQATPFTALASTMTLLTSPGLSSTVFTGVSVSSVAVQWTGGGNPVGMSFIAQISTDNFATLNFSSTTQNLSAIFGTGGAGPALVPDTDYNFRVEASSGLNNSAFVVLGSTYTLAEPPTGTSIPIVSSNSVALQWQSNGNPAGANYEVWQDTSALFLTPLINTAAGNSYIASGLAPSTSYYFKVEAVNGDNIPTAFDLTVSAMTSMPSYVVPPSLDVVRVYPNPYKPNGGNPDFGKPYNPGDPTSGVILDQLPPQTTIRIYTLTGRLVTELGPPNSQGVIQWSAKNSIGQDVASGVYFAVLSGPAGKATKKIIVIR